LETDMTNVNSSFQTNYKDVSHSLLNLDETHEIVSRGAGISYRVFKDYQSCWNTFIC
jgi:hypothetical protein